MTVTSVTSATSAAAVTRSSSQNLGQADFIKLLTTELKSQDPTNPTDNKEMIAQMAQFSSLSGIDQINTTLKGISVQLDQVLTAQAAVPNP